MICGSFGGFGKIASFAKTCEQVADSLTRTTDRLGDFLLAIARHPHLEDAPVA